VHAQEIIKKPTAGKIAFDWRNRDSFLSHIEECALTAAKYSNPGLCWIKGMIPELHRDREV